MDHFNATVHNGALVSTRRGLHVSKTKHQGTRFVNTFAAPTSAASNIPSRSESRGSADSSEARPQERKFKFVAKQPREKSRASGRGRPRASPASKSSTPRSGSEESYDDIGSGRASSRASSSTATINPVTDSPQSIGAPSEHAFGMSPIAANYFPKQWHNQTPNQEPSGMENGSVNLHLDPTSRQPYPFDELPIHNPVRGSHYSERSPNEMVDMQSMFLDPMGNQGSKAGEQSSEDLNVNVDKLYGSVNNALYDDGGPNEPAMLESIASMALVELFMGRYDNWREHMKNLRYLINRSGGLKPEWGHVLSKIRKADVKGAAYTGTLPYLDFTRLFTPISDIMSPEMRTSLAHRIQLVFRPCHISPDIIESVRALVLFAQATKISHHAPVGTIIFDANAYIEEYTWVEQRLVRCPKPLREEVFGLEQPYMQKQRMQNLDIGLLQQFGGPSFQHQLPQAHTVASSVGNPLNPIIRIASILYLEELLPEPYTLEPYNFLFSMLNQQVRAVATRLRERKYAQDPAFSLDGLPQTQFLQPVLTWACMVAYAVAKVADLDTTIQTVMLDLSPYQDCIGLLVGSKPTDVDVLNEQAFKLCDLLPVQALRTVNCDDRTFLKQIVSDYASRQLLEPIDPYLQGRANYGMTG